MGNLSQSTDRRGNAATYTCDSLNPPTYNGTIIYSYDTGNHLASAVLAGTITSTYGKLIGLFPSRPHRRLRVDRGVPSRGLNDTIPRTLPKFVQRPNNL